MATAPTVETAIRDLLLEDADLTALLGDRIYPQDAPQTAEPPYVLYFTADPEQTLTLNGYINNYNQAFRFDCYGGPLGRSYSSAKAIAKALRTCLFSFLRGTAPGGVEIQGILDDGGEDGLEPPIHGEEEGLDYVGVQVRVHWNY